jgi:hypothetical protein
MPSLAGNTETAILERIIRAPRSGMSPAAAESLLRLGFQPADHRRMSELLAAAQAGNLTPDETVELENYRNVGRMVDLLQSQARQTLSRRPAK